jgi:hypothetical protein
MNNTLSLSLEEYEALISLAREGTKDDAGQVNHDLAKRLDDFLLGIERANSFVRDGLWVQWQEADQPLPPTARFPEVWPPTQRAYIEYCTRRVTLSDVESVLRTQARRPLSVLVTKDPGATYGWTELSKHFR